VSLRKQGATKGATTAFMISTPESGVDSIAVTYALLDPVMTVARPAAAFITAFAAGTTENLFSYRKEAAIVPSLHPCLVDGCCDGRGCDPETHRNLHGFMERLGGGVRYAVSELLGGHRGLVFRRALADRGHSALQLIHRLHPDRGGPDPQGLEPRRRARLSSFFLPGPPRTSNIATVTVLVNLLGKRATAIYLAAIAVFAVLAGLAVDQVYALLGISAEAAAGQAAEIMPEAVRWGAAALVLLISIKPVSAGVRRLLQR
jgi:hypothetical protein